MFLDQDWQEIIIFFGEEKTMGLGEEKTRKSVFPRFGKYYLEQKINHDTPLTLWMLWKYLLIFHKYTAQITLISESYEKVGLCYRENGKMH